MQTAQQQGNVPENLQLTMGMVAHLQRIADRSGDAVLKETANKAHSAFSKGISEAPGVHLTRITPEQATELVQLAVRTQDHELADFARYCQSVADTTGIGIEPSPNKINEEINKGRQELAQKGPVHTGPGYGAAFASVGTQQRGQQGGQQGAQQGAQQGQQQGQQQGRQQGQQQGQQIQQGQGQPQQAGGSGGKNLQLDISQVSHIRRIADRTGDPLLQETARRAQSAWAKGLSDTQGVHLTWITPQQATELVNLAIKTQDHELADFARYCQSVAATTGIALEPTPGKIQQELEKGRQELQQGAVHTGPGYGAAFASVSGNQGQAGQGQGQQQQGQGQQQGQQWQPKAQQGPGQQQGQQGQGQQGQSGHDWQKESSGNLRLTMDVVAHIQRIADRTGNQMLKETANRAHSACVRGLNEAPGVHLTWITQQEATELVNLAVQTQDRELADFARYCQSVAQTSQIGIEPTPGKIQQEIQKGRQELQQQGRAHTGPGYGAAFASQAQQQQQQIQQGQEQQGQGQQGKGQQGGEGQGQQGYDWQGATNRGDLKLTMDVVAHIQRIADRTGNQMLKETANRAHSACRRGETEAAGINLTWISADEASQLVNIAIQTQDKELADFARYCQSVSQTTGVGLEPTPGKIQQELEKGQ